MKAESWHIPAFLFLLIQVALRDFTWTTSHKLANPENIIKNKPTKVKLISPFVTWMVKISHDFQRVVMNGSRVRRRKSLESK